MMVFRLTILVLFFSLTSTALRTADSRIGVFDRAPATCNSGDYTSDLGLVFNIFCDRSFTAVASTTFTSNDLNTCINSCAEARACYAATFDADNSICSYYNQTGAVGAVSAAANTHTAYVNPTTQLTAGFDTRCPYANGSSQAINGMNFTIKCGLDENYNDYCPDNVPSCKVHKESMADCIQFCTESHPLCTAVSWNPDLIAGYGNCYLKSGAPTNGFVLAQGLDIGNDFWVHTAVESTSYGSSVTYDCQDQASASASNGQTFVASCNMNMAGNNITMVHEDSLGDCVDNCATWSDGSCLGVVYDARMTHGWENCLLKNATNQLVASTNVTVLLRSQAANSGSGNNSTSGGDQSGHSATGAIVGGVVGGVAAVAIAAALVWYFCFRRKRRNQKPLGTQDNIPYQQSAAGPSLGGANQKSELSEHHGVSEIGDYSYGLQPKSEPTELPAELGGHRS